MNKSNRKAGVALGSLLALPCRFVTGYLTGLLTAAAGLAAIVGGVYLLTRKVPFVSHTFSDRDAEGGQHLSLTLMSPDEAQAAFAREKERIGAELKTLGAEIKALAEQAKTKTSGSEEH